MFAGLAVWSIVVRFRGLYRHSYDRFVYVITYLLHAVILTWLWIMMDVFELIRWHDLGLGIGLLNLNRCWIR